jgi:hypothetical protein
MRDELLLEAEKLSEVGRGRKGEEKRREGGWTKND